MARVFTHCVTTVLPLRATGVPQNRGIPQDTANKLAVREDKVRT